MLLNQKNKSKMSYAAIAEKMGIDRSGAYQAINNPWRTTIETYLKAAEILNYPPGIAVGEWRRDNLNKIKLKLHLPNKAYEYEKLFKDLKNKTKLTYRQMSKKTGLGKSTCEAVSHNPHICSWETICKVLNLLDLDVGDYYNPWKYAVYSQKEKNIDAAIRESKEDRA